jgi:hypothetical protein
MWLPKLFNVFLWLFVLDAGITTALDAYQALAGTPSTISISLHTTVATLTTIAAILVLLAISSYRKTPWHMVLLPLIFVFWGSLVFIPLPAVVSLEKIFRFAGLAQLMVAGGCFWTMRMRFPDCPWRIPAKIFEGNTFSIARLFCSTLIKVFIVGPILIIGICVSLVWSLEKISHGFISISGDGLYTEKRVYDYEGKEIHLLPTVHIASSDFYANLIRELPKNETVILPEGVTDRRNLIRDGLDYSGPAESAGLSTQPSFVDISKLAFRSCDVDVSEFSDSTLRDLNNISRCLKRWTAGDHAACLEELSQMRSPDLNSMKEDLLSKRNARVNKALKEALQEFKHIGIPWGAAHMPGIEDDVLKMGAKKLSGERICVFKWADLTLNF